MKKNTMILNILLAVVLGIGLFVGLIWRTLVPNVVLPGLEGTSMVAMTLIALVLEYYLAGTDRRNLLLQTVLAAVTFGILGMVAGLPGGVQNFVSGGIVFAVITLLFDSMVQRMEVTVEKKGAVIPTAFVLYLACQCFMGMF